MNSSKRARYTNEAFPPYAHRPGQTIHPAKPGGHSFEVPEKEGQRLSPYMAETNDQFLLGLDYLNHGYFWESHVEFEAIWHAHQRRGVAADLLKSLIKFGAAGVKASINSEEAAMGHLLRARELLSPISEEECLKWTSILKSSYLSILDQALVTKTILDEHGLLAEITLEHRSS